MNKTIIFENIVKLTRYSKLFREIHLNEIQTQIFNYCCYPKKGKATEKPSMKDLCDYILANQNYKNKSDILNMKLLEYINK